MSQFKNFQVSLFLKVYFKQFNSHSSQFSKFFNHVSNLILVYMLLNWRLVVGCIQLFQKSSVLFFIGSFLSLAGLLSEKNRRSSFFLVKVPFFNYIFALMRLSFLAVV